MLKNLEIIVIKQAITDEQRIKNDPKTLYRNKAILFHLSLLFLAVLIVDYSSKNLMIRKQRSKIGCYSSDKQRM